MDSGKRPMGCLMGPDSYRTAGLAQALGDLGHRVEDLGNLSPASFAPDQDDGPLHARNQTIGWTNRLIRVAGDAVARGMPIFLGGDGLQTVTAFGLLADVATGYPVLLSEMTILTALRTAATSAMVARHLDPGAQTRWR